MAFGVISDLEDLRRVSALNRILFAVLILVSAV